MWNSQTVHSLQARMLSLGKHFENPMAVFIKAYHTYPLRPPNWNPRNVCRYTKRRDSRTYAGSEVEATDK